MSIGSPGRLPTSSTPRAHTPGRIRNGSPRSRAMSRCNSGCRPRRWSTRAAPACEVAQAAASHHERLDGHGYFRGLSAPEIAIGARVVAVADVFEALTAER
ncbi:MAG: hypothetical protein H0T59_00145, partial [Chloroflexi bacterium]|nr:hypothetical protein [Chloroflexota bacterium]